MPYNNKQLLLSFNKPAPQYFNPATDDYEVLQGAFGASRVLLYDASGNPLFTAANPATVKVAAGTNKIGSVDAQLTGSKVAEGIADYRLNTEGILLASAARTTTTGSPTMTNYNARGVMISLNITAASGTGGLKVAVYGVDTISGQGTALLTAATPVTTAIISQYIIYPGATGSSPQTSSLPLPRAWSVLVTAVDATSYTYSLGYSFIL